MLDAPVRPPSPAFRGRSPSAPKPDKTTRSHPPFPHASPPLASSPPPHPLPSSLLLFSLFFGLLCHHLCPSSVLHCSSSTSSLDYLLPVPTPISPTIGMDGGSGHRSTRRSPFTRRAWMNNGPRPHWPEAVPAARQGRRARSNSRTLDSRCGQGARAAGCTAPTADQIVIAAQVSITDTGVCSPTPAPCFGSRWGVFISAVH
jgi:hypothetical protein